MRRITIRASIVIAAPPTAVFDYTQDYACRAEWDPAVRKATLTSLSPARTAEIRGAGFACRLRYRTFDRPRKTSLVMENVKSGLIVGGGGAWRYEPVGGGTRWLQTNTLTLRTGPRILARPIAWFLRGVFSYATRRAMRRARARIESGRTSPTRPRTCAAA